MGNIVNIVEKYVPYELWQKVIEEFDKAVDEEKNVIEETFHRGFMDGMTIPRSDKFQNGKQYYQKNFK
jgi:hypothetical protein